MYHKHQTEGIVLKTFESGDSSIVASIFTRDLGLVHARVQNGRGLHSKMRGDIQVLTLGHFVLLKGSSGWKLVGALGEKNLWIEMRDQKIKVKKMADILSLIKFHIAEEGGHSEIFVHLKDFLFKLPKIKLDRVRAAEHAILLKILNETGVLRREGVIQSFVENFKIDEESLDFVENHSRLVVGMINESLKALEVRM